MLRKPTHVLCCLILFAAGLFAEEEDRVSLEARYWDPGLSGSVLVVDEEFGTTVDLESDLALKEEASTELRLTFRTSERTKLQLARLPLSYSGDSVISRDIEFAGQTFTLNSPVQSQLDLDYYRLGFSWQFLSSSDGRFRAGPIVEVKAFEGDAGLTASLFDLTASVQEDFEGAFGSAGISIDLEPTDRFHIYADFTVLVESDEGDQTDLEVGLRVKAWQALGISVGYRAIDFSLEEGSDELDLDISGPFLGAVLSF